MLKGFERTIATIEQRLVLIAPPHARVHPTFENVVVDPGERDRLVREAQQLRGRVYLEDGAVQPHHLTPDGLHATPEDDASWHVLFVNGCRRVTAGIWYMEHGPTVTFERLRLNETPLAQRRVWRDRLRAAVTSDLVLAGRDDLRFAEVGGWAVSKESRCGFEGLLLALAGYSLGNLLGGAIGITTATVRHSSSSILKRLGGTELGAGETTVPTYYDPRYGCEMEMLRFDSRVPNEKYAGIVALLKDKLAEVPIFSAADVVEEVGARAFRWRVSNETAPASFVPAPA